MRHLRLILVLCALAFSLALALLKPLGARAATGAAQRPAAARHLQSSLAFGLRVVGYAKRFVGVRYSYGGSSPRSGFDCSGFVRYVYAHFGVSLPHSSYAQFGDGRRVARGRLRPGDLVFFDGLGHVGLYVGSGRFIHAPHTGTRVRIETLAGWYSSRFDGARRLRTA
jgi:cell wall-associated NlpC family hydrolase